AAWRIFAGRGRSRCRGAVSPSPVAARATERVPSGTRDALLVCRSAPRRVPAPRSPWYMTVPMEDITQELTKLVAKTLKVSPDQLRPEADLVTDLGADSLAVVELMMALEERPGVR